METKSKRTLNVTAIKMKYVGYTNHKGARYIITQLWDGKRKTVPFNHSKDSGVAQISDILDNSHVIHEWSVVIDNTQNDYHIISIVFAGSEFTDIF